MVFHSSMEDAFPYLFFIKYDIGQINIAGDASAHLWRCKKELCLMVGLLLFQELHTYREGNLISSVVADSQVSSPSILSVFFSCSNWFAPL